MTENADGRYALTRLYLARWSLGDLSNAATVLNDEACGPDRGPVRQCLYVAVMAELRRREQTSSDDPLAEIAEAAALILPVAPSAYEAANGVAVVAFMMGTEISHTARVMLGGLAVYLADWIATLTSPTPADGR